MLGVKSLFGHTVGGAAGAVGRITGAMGNLLNTEINFKDEINKLMGNIENNFKLISNINFSP